MSNEMIMNMLLIFIGFLLFTIGILIGFLASHEDWFCIKKADK